MNSCKRHRNVTWTFQIIAAAILFQTLFFKFSGAEEAFRFAVDEIEWATL